MTSLILGFFLISSETEKCYTLNNGDIIIGFEINTDETGYLIRTDDGTVKIKYIDIKDVESSCSDKKTEIVYSKENNDNIKENNDDIKEEDDDIKENNIKEEDDDYVNYEDDYENRSYSEIGGALGLPGGIMTIYGYRHNGFGFRVSAGYLYFLYGFKAGIGARQDSERGTTHGFSIYGGMTNIDGLNFVYVEPAYSIHGRRFFFETGLAVGKGDFINPQLMIQIGILGRTE